MPFTTWSVVVAAAASSGSAPAWFGGQAAFSFTTSSGLFPAFGGTCSPGARLFGQTESASGNAVGGTLLLSLLLYGTKLQQLDLPTATEGHFGVCKNQAGVSQ